MQTFFDLRQNLEEKLLMVGGDREYGQVLFLAGGGGSGKGFAMSNYIGLGRMPKTVDPDAFKTLFIKWNDVHKRDLEVAARCNKDAVPTPDKPCMKDPEFVFKLHMLLKRYGWQDRDVETFLSTRRTPDLLPNIVFDQTFKDLDNFKYLIPLVLKAGYQPKNIHLVWVLADYNIAVKQNLSRDRVVPPEVLIHAHTGAAETILDLTMRNYPSPALMDGEVWVTVGRANRIVSELPYLGLPQSVIASKAAARGIGGSYFAASMSKNILKTVADSVGKKNPTQRDIAALIDDYIAMRKVAPQEVVDELVKVCGVGSYIAKPDGSPSSLKFIRLKGVGKNFDSPETVWKKIGCHVCKNTPLADKAVCADQKLDCK